MFRILSDLLEPAAVLIAVIVAYNNIETRLAEVQAQLKKAEDRFHYDWTGMSAELLIQVYRSDRSLMFYAGKQFFALASAINMPVTGDWLTFDHKGKTYSGEVVHRRVQYKEVDSTPSEGASGTRDHMLVDLHVVCHDEDGYAPPGYVAPDASK